MRPAPISPDRHTELAGVVERNIRALLERRREEEQQRAAIFGLWVAVNLGLLPVRPFDPTFVTLAMVASVEAIFLSTFVLITQNRMAALAGRRADLDLQISLLAEHEISRVIRLAAAIAERMGIEEARDPEIAELERDVPPERVMERIETHERESETNGDRLS